MDNRLLLFLLFTLATNKTTESTGLKGLSDYISTLKVNRKYTLEKINIIRKVGPYLPEAYIPIINKSILVTEGFLKVSELKELLNSNEYHYINDPIVVKDTRDRLNKIVTTLKKESPKFESNNLGMIMDLIINMDTYKSMFSMLSTVMSNSDSLNDPSTLINMLAPILGLEDGKDKDKMKEMSGMLEILKLLNSPKKEESIEKVSSNQEIKAEERPTKE